MCVDFTRTSASPRWEAVAPPGEGGPGQGGRVGLVQEEAADQPAERDAEVPAGDEQRLGDDPGRPGRVGDGGLEEGGGAAQAEDALVGRRDQLALIDPYPRTAAAVLDGVDHNLQVEAGETLRTLLGHWLGPAGARNPWCRERRRPPDRSYESYRSGGRASPSQSAIAGAEA
ncbi:hypothetical protein ACIQI7_11445 [Kitasatospora sp. NPDC092039]|uniref:hypothetical protein n=1 Tax=Kitasatospora sp. NPDC092039 TaxID=3364086 RepID=UPI00382C515D